MPIKSKLLFILIGDDKTGKTTFQKFLIENLHNLSYQKLEVNLGFPIKHAQYNGIHNGISYSNRSIQEKLDVYKSIDEYFSKHFNPKDIAVISSHLNFADVEEMIRHGKAKYYNVIGVFFTNSIMYSPDRNSKISGLNWDERLVVENPHATGDVITKQLQENAESFVKMLIKRTNI
ncbi:MAG: hypothetical protein PSV16_00705 [Flavobacterium sp.]|nr:hypothetical protein [Flavobacterium sp.]